MFEASGFGWNTGILIVVKWGVTFHKKLQILYLRTHIV